MVFFICEACGETLKKNKVDAHSWGCRNCWAFACMDCGMRFEGEAYKQHMSCVSEAQKYQGKLYQSKENKGEVKQRSWIEGVQQRLESAPGGSQLRPFAERLLAYENLPRKKAKFINFAKNSLNLKADRDGIAEKLWLLVDESGAAPASYHRAGGSDVGRCCNIHAHTRRAASRRCACSRSTCPSPGYMISWVGTWRE